MRVAENLLKMIDNPDFDGNYLYDAEPVMRGSIRDLREETVSNAGGTEEKSMGSKSAPAAV